MNGDDWQFPVTGDDDRAPVTGEEFVFRYPQNPNNNVAGGVKLERLEISESTEVNNFLDDPDGKDVITYTGGTIYSSATRFEDLNISPELLRGLYVEMKFDRPSKIQEVTLPMILSPPYKDLIAQAHNGSGKTACFVLGMLSRVNPTVASPQALCICPTRELAMQTIEILQKMAKFTSITSDLAIPPDQKNFVPLASRPPVTAQVVIGTPGTINRLIAAKKFSMREMKILVFDEADHMLAESGFKADSVKIMQEIIKLSSHCQVLLFSATYSDTVREFISNTVGKHFLKEHNVLYVNREELALRSVKQYKVSCPDELAKVSVIKDKVLELGQRIGQTIIFVRSRESAKMLQQSLVTFGYEVTNIQGDLPLDKRDKVVREFRDGLTQVLISTDVLARGFDQSQVNLVINYDLPVVRNNPSEPDYEVYLHRIGRAGRFGRNGAAFNLLCADGDSEIMEKIEKHFGKQVIEVPSWDSNEDFEAALRMAGLM